MKCIICQEPGAEIRTNKNGNLYFYCGECGPMHVHGRSGQVALRKMRDEAGQPDIKKEDKTQQNKQPEKPAEPPRTPPEKPINRRTQHAKDEAHVSFFLG